MRRITAAVLGLGLASCGSDVDETGNSVKPGDRLADLEQHGVVECSNPAQRSLTPWVRTQLPSPSVDLAWIVGGGAIAGDLDGDGDPDVVAPNQAAQASVFLSTGGDTFAERADVLAAFDLSQGTGGSLADYDGDGDLDLYITRDQLPNRLLRNDGALQFTDVTDQAGVDACDPVSGQCFHSMSSSWADYDRDGDLNLIASNYGHVPHDGTLAPQFNPADPSFLYRNEGDGTFADITREVLPYDGFAGVHDGYTYISSFLDLNGDQWPELYFINDFGTAFPNVLLWNHEGELRLDQGAHGLDLAMTGMCLAVADNNGDQLPDLFISEWDKLRYLESNTDFGVWLDVQTSPLGLVPFFPQKVPWGCEYGDLDLDGDLDLVVQYGYVRNDGTEAWSNPLTQPDAVYLQGDGGVFVDQAASWGMADAQVGRGFVTADFNQDGYLDVFKRDVMGPELHYMSQCGEGRWLEIDLRQPGTMNTHAVGATVDVLIGDASHRRWLMAGGMNFSSAAPPTLHFGLESARADEIIVTWPDGEVSRFFDVPTRQRLTITRK